MKRRPLPVKRFVPLVLCVALLASGCGGGEPSLPSTLSASTP
jgi:hypothetical protein